ncbi:MAG: hypothetical protein AB7L92_06270 [Alphaproteobacteria bacterium]
MDTEKYLILEKKIEKGLSPTDEGPFYHHGWWESYKGSIKGKLGGVVIGGLMGAIVGLAVAATLATFSTLPTLALGMAFAGITGAGILYGAHEFGDIGKIQGSVAAGLEQADGREALRFAALEKKIDALTEAVKIGVGGETKKNVDAITQKADQEADALEKELETYRTTHYANYSPDKKNRVIFGKVAAIGLVVGAIAGALLAFGGGAEHIFHALGIKGLEAAGTMVASVITFGMFGASFGLNRDLFRKIFDKTDLWSKGMLSHKRVREQQLAAGRELEDDTNGKNDQKTEAPKAEIKAQPAYDGIKYPESDTYYQDKVLAAAEKALLSFDHTRATPH